MGVCGFGHGSRPSHCASVQFGTGAAVGAGDPVGGGGAVHDATSQHAAHAPVAAHVAALALQPYRADPAVHMYGSTRGHRCGLAQTEALQAPVHERSQPRTSQHVVHCPAGGATLQHCCAPEGSTQRNGTSGVQLWPAQIVPAHGAHTRPRARALAES